MELHRLWLRAICNRRLCVRVGRVVYGCPMPSDLDREDFLYGLVTRLADLGRSQTWLAVEVAKEEGREDPYSQAHVADWLRGRRSPNPEQVFALERALDVEPGALSRLLGYLPVEAVATVTVEDAVKADPGLTKLHREAVLALYRALVTPGKER